MILEELEKKMAELDELQAETENAHAKLKAQMAELEKLQAEAENAHAKLIAQMAELKERGEEKPKPPHPRLKPEYKGKYYIVFYNGCSVETFWTGCTSDSGEYAIGNIFKTKAEAEFAIERLKVLAEMSEWAGNWDDEFNLRYNETSGVEIFTQSLPEKSYGEMRFATKEDAINCIKTVGEDRIKKYYFMIPEDETNE